MHNFCYADEYDKLRSDSIRKSDFSGRENLLIDHKTNFNSKSFPIIIGNSLKYTFMSFSNLKNKLFSGVFKNERMLFRYWVTL